MAHDVGIEVTSPVIEESAHSASARRMRIHRERRRQGLLCVTTLLGRAQIEGLIRRGWLPREERADRAAVQRALYSYLSDVLG
jgi:hypothetical protein